MIVISGYHARSILKGWNAESSEISVSLDLGLSEGSVRFNGNFVEFPDGQRLSRSLLEKMSGVVSDCFYLEECNAYPVQCFSEYSKKFLKLYATGPSTAPTVSVSGIRMHQTKNHDPIADTLLKVRSIRISGIVLDSCTGLGYTAIYAIKAGAERVITIEKDPMMVEIAKRNPWSQQLFNDARIELCQGDTAVVVKTFEDGFFDCVIHDPPRFSLAGELYSLDFYRELYRVLKPCGRLFHYVGNPGGRYRNVSTLPGVRKRLHEAGFTTVERCPNAQGVRAFK